MSDRAHDAERRRLQGDDADAWRRWGPYLSERAWGTVREDYSADGDAWSFFPHEHARSRAYRWDEDGLAGLSDDRQRLCFALALWNGADPILKERRVRPHRPEGNHGEDVKEYWCYVDSTPTHSWMRWRYNYPQRAFPYGDLVEENARRGRHDPEFELLDTGVFDEDRYFDVTVEYAKADAGRHLHPDHRARTAGPDSATLHVLPTLWFRDTWSWRLGVRRPGDHRVAGRAPSWRSTRSSARWCSRATATPRRCSATTRRTPSASGGSPDPRIPRTASTTTWSTAPRR